MEQTSGASDVSPISLDGRFVRLRPITQADYGFLWQCRWSPEIMPLWMQGRTMPSFEQYVRELESGLAGHLLTLLLIETAAEQRPIGFVIAYDFSPQDRYTFFNIALAPAFSDLGWGVEAILLFLEYLFTYFDLRKVCMDIYDFNSHPLAVLLRSGAPQEGRFRQQRYYQGAYHDVIRLGLLQEEWTNARDVLAGLLAPPAPPNPEEIPLGQAPDEMETVVEALPDAATAMPALDDSRASNATAAGKHEQRTRRNGTASARTRNAR